MRSAIVTVALCLVAVACGSDGTTGEAVTGTPTGSGPDQTTDSGVPPTGDTVSNTTTDGNGSAPSASGTSGSGSQTTDGETGAVSLGVAPDGLVVIEGASTSILPFGTARDQTVTALELVLGTPAQSEELSDECPNQADEALSWPGQIRIDIRDDEVISWSLDRGSPLTTLSGVGLGSTRDEIESSIVIEVSETSLGIEFTTDPDGVGMNGLLTGDGPTDTVTDLWAGEICAFR